MIVYIYPIMTEHNIIEYIGLCGTNAHLESTNNNARNAHQRQRAGMLCFELEYGRMVDFSRIISE